MRFLLVTLALASLAAAEVDIVHTGAGLCVGWTKPSEAGLWNVDESSFHYFGPCHESISLGLNDGLVTDIPSLVVSVSSDDEEQNDSIMVFDALNCVMMDSRPVVPDSILQGAPPAPYSVHEIHVSRYSHDMRMLMGCSMGAYASTMSDCFYTNSSLVDDGGSIGFGEHRCRMWSGGYYWPPRVSGPVGILGSSVCMEGYGYAPYPYSYYLVSTAWDLPTDGGSVIDSLFNCTFYTVSTTETPAPLVLAMGSSGNHVVALWREENYGEVNTTLFIDDVQPWITEEFPFPSPVAEPAAMSCHPYYSGMLLTWVKGDSLMCRHYDGGWNDYDRVLQTGVGTVGDRDLAVCSVSDGYWIAWLESGELFPEVLFVDEDSVTGVGRQAFTPEMPGLELYPNPFTASVQIVPAGLTGNCRISIYDSAGRTVATAETEEEAWTWCPGDEPAGIYHVVLSTETFTVSRRLVHLR